VCVAAVPPSAPGGGFCEGGVQRGAGEAVALEWMDPPACKSLQLQPTQSNIAGKINANNAKAGARAGVWE
jgi:hypothetical protein